MKTLAEQIAVMQGYAEGRDVLVRTHRLPRGSWAACSFPVWNWADFEYKLAPPSPPKDLWVNIYNCGSAAHPSPSKARDSVSTEGAKHVAVHYKLCE